MDSESDTQPSPTREIELDILKAVHELGPIRPTSPTKLPAVQRLDSKYKSDREQQQVTVVINCLLEERLLFPYFSVGKEQSNMVRGITPKGLERLERLQHPRRTWMKENWFALVIALITGSSAIGGAVISALLR